MGVNVYVAEVWLSTTAGFHVPVTPLSEVAGSVGTVPPGQIVKPPPKLNVGVRFGVMLTVNVVVVAHCPVVGVKV